MVRMLIFLHLTFLLWTRIFSSEIGEHNISKCCPEGEMLDFTDLSSVFCVPINPNLFGDIYNKSVEDFLWFPMDAVVNSTTLKIHQNNSERYLEVLKENYQINTGCMPQCGKKYPVQNTFFKKGFVEHFHLILFDDNSFRIHISNEDTLHDPDKDFVSFERVNETEDEVETPAKYDVGSLRTFPLADSCVDSVDHQMYVLVSCPCQFLTCIRKCCRDNFFLNESTNECQPIVHTLNIQNWRPKTVNNSRYYLLTEAMPSCDSFVLKTPSHDDESCNTNDFKESDHNFTIFSNGSVKIQKYRRPYLPDKYCGEATWHESGFIYEQNLIICRRPSANRNPKEQPLRFVLYGTLLILGGVCLLITVSVSFFLPELKRRIHNKIALCHNFSLMVAYFAAGIVQLVQDPARTLGDKGCTIFGLLVQFSFLGSFFWLNVMCIDISMTFSATRSVGDKSSSRYSKKFIYYSMYAWGTTSTISIVTVIMEYLPKMPYNFIRPGLTCYCGFDNDTSAILLYFYGPMAFTLGLNLALFIFTMIKIMKIQRQTAILHKSESNATGGASYQSDKQRLILYAKLFLLMGLTWVTEIASWAIGGPDYYWYLSDVINLLRAVFIFILFICKKPVLRSLKRKLNGESLSFSNSSMTSTSGSSRLSHPRFSTNSKPNKRKNLVMMDVDNKRKQLVAELSSSNLNKRRETRS